MPLIRKFRLTYGTVPPGERGGGTTGKMTEGYTVSSPPDIPYRYLLQVLPSAEKTYPLFVALSDLLDSECMGVLEVHESEAVVTYGSVGVSREGILSALEPCSFRLVNDGYTGFGVASPSFEVFVTDHKDVRVFAQELSRVETVLGTFDLRKRRSLRLLGPERHYHVPLVAYFEEEKIARLGEPLPARELDRYRREPQSYGEFRQSIIEQLRMRIQSRTKPT